MTTDLLSAPPKPRGRPREFDMDAALDQALRVFSERGYQAASISDLTEAMDLTAGSVYKAFKDKRGIFLAAFDRYRGQRLALQRRAIDRGTTGREKLAALLGIFAASAHGAEGIRGCLTVNSATDLALFDEEVAAQISAAYRHDERALADLIRLGQADGTLRADTDPDDTARALLCLTKGMRVVGKTGRTSAEMTSVVATMLTLLT